VVDARAESGERTQFRSKAEAELYRNKLIRQRYAEKYGELVGDITFEKFIEVYAEKKPWKTDTYRTRVLISLEAMAFQDVSLTRITPEMVEEYRDKRLTTCEPSTVRQDLAALSDCFRWAVKLHYANQNPVKDVGRPSLPVMQDNPAEYLSAEEFGDLLAVAGNDQPLYKFAVWTGLRVSELLHLEWPDIKDGYVIVRRGKGRKQRLVPLAPQAEEALKQTPRHLKEPRVFWWMGDRYTTLRRFKRRLVRAKITKPYTFHALRHTFASYAAMSRVDLKVIAEALGHTTTSVTRRYAHLSPDYRRNELLKMRLGTPEAHVPAKPSEANES
jgi:integrase